MRGATNRLVPKLTVVLHADVVGSTAMVQRDEALAHDRIRDSFARLAARVRAYGGTTHEVRGDALLAEFSRASDAVCAALGFQDDNAAANAAIDDEVRPAVRIGISLGEVVVADGTLTGPDVVLAQRLEQLSPPGGVCVSDTVRQSVPGRMPIDFEGLGECRVKGFDDLVVAWLASLAPEASLPAPRAQPERISGRRRGVSPVAAAALALTLGVGGWWWLDTRADFEPVDPAEMAHALPDKPSIAVLPFANLGADPADDFIGDGLTDSTISVLTSSPDIFVISRNTSLKYKGQAVSPRDVATALGVRYVLEGTVQRSGDSLRVTTLLADAVDGRNLWSERFDTTVGDLFAVQDEITARVVEELHVKLTVGSQARTWIRQTGGPAAYLKMLRGRAHFQTFSPEGHAEAERIWRELLAEHPDQAYEALIGWILWQKVTLGLSKDPAADLREAKRLGELTVARHPHYAISYTMLGAVSLGLREHEDALAYAGRALELEPGGADANMIAGWINAASGRPGEGVDLMRRGMRYEPDYPHWLPGALGTALIMAGRYDEAESLARGVLAKASEDVRAHPTALMHLAVTAELTGRHGEATEHVARLRELWPGVSLQGLRPGMSLFKDQDYVERRIDALRRAGVPEGA